MTDGPSVPGRPRRGAPLIALAAVFLVVPDRSEPVGGYAAEGQTTGVSVSVAMGSVTLTQSPAENPFQGAWTLADNGDGTADLEGTMAFGEHATRVDVRVRLLGSMSGTVNMAGGEHAIGGTGSWDGRAFRLHIPTGAPNSGVASSYVGVGTSCEGSGSVFGSTVCGSFAATTPEWEGLTVELVFVDDLSSFTGTVTAVERSGSGLNGSTTTFRFSVAGTRGPGAGSLGRAGP